MRQGHDGYHGSRGRLVNDRGSREGLPPFMFGFIRIALQHNVI
jgi:hypothetical protein